MENTEPKKATLIIIDMQVDFITGALANPDAERIVDPICELIKGWTGDIIVTMDVHGDDYLQTAEGKKLPVKHCIAGTKGECLDSRIHAALNSPIHVVPNEDSVYRRTRLKNTFALYWSPRMLNEDVYIVGTRTDISVISNALVLKSACPENNIIVYENLCAGTAPERHKAAIEVMKSCQIDILTYGGAE